jgi:hypothetical protein
MSDWLDKPEDIAEAMKMVPLAEQFAKVVKAAVRAKLEEGVEVPGFKLRAGGRMTTYDACKAAKILMDTGIITVDELMGAMRFSPTGLNGIWAEKVEMTKAEGRKDLVGRLKEASETKPKSSSVVKDRG